MATVIASGGGLRCCFLISGLEEMAAQQPVRPGSRGGERITRDVNSVRRGAWMAADGHSISLSSACCGNATDDAGYSLMAAPVFLCCPVVFVFG